MGTKYKFIFVAAVIFSCTSNTQAQWAYNIAINTPVCTSAGNQAGVVSISDGLGGTIFAWEDQRYSTRAIYAQRLDSLGYPMWGPDGVPIAAIASPQFNPLMISDGRGGALISFVVGKTNNNDLYIQRMDALGNKRWGAAGIQVSGSTDQDDNQSMDSDGKGGAYLAWNTYPYGKHLVLDDLTAQYIDSSGTAVWMAGGQIVNNQFNAQVNPSICRGPGGGAYIAWQQIKFAAPDQDIYLQRVNGFGANQLGAKALKVSGAPDEAFPLLCTDGAGGAFFLWSHQPSGPGTILASRIDTAGTPIWSAAACTTAERTIFPQLVYQGNGTALIGWLDVRNGGTAATDVYAQKIGPAGILWAVNGAPVCTAPDYQNAFRCDNDGNGGAYFTWTDHRTGGDFSKCEIYGQRLNPDGSPAWKLNGVPVSTAAQGQDRPTVSGVPNSGMVAAWEDYRVNVSNTGIYAQKIFMDGTVPPTPPAVLQRSTKNIVFPTVKVNVRKDTTFTISNPGGDTLRITSITSSNPAFTQTMLMKNILPGANVKDTVRFKPTVSGFTEGYFLFTSNSATSPDTLYVSGSGSGSATLSLSVKNISFGRVRLGASKDSLLTTTNTGTDTLRISGGTSSLPAFKTSTKASAILPTKSVIDTLRFTPTQLGAVSGIIVINSNTTSGKDTIKVSGTGYGLPKAQLSVTSIPFGDLEAGKSKTLGFTLTNSGDDTLTVVSILSGSPLFTVKDMPQILLPNASLTDSVKFSPVGVGAAAGMIIIRTNATKSSDTVKVTGNGTPTVGIEGTPAAERGFALSQNYPNPFNPTTTFSYSVPNTAHVSIIVTDAFGREVRTIVNGTADAGVHSVSFDGTKLPSGSYFVTMRSGSFVQIRTMTQMK